MQSALILAGAFMALASTGSKEEIRDGINGFYEGWNAGANLPPEMQNAPADSLDINRIQTMPEVADNTK